MELSRRHTIALSVLIGSAAACAPAPTHTAPAPRSTVTGDDFKDQNEPIEIVLQKKVPGLAVTRNSDGSLSLQIRGASSRDGSDTSPLYVLNGLTFHPGPGGALSGIDPREIESVRVLKGAEAGLYGIDGANGVIVITTKKPPKKSP